MLDRLTFTLAVAVCLAAGPAVLAEASERRDHERARRAFQQGEIRPLSEILAGLRPELGGEVIKLELERKDGAYIYELRVLAPDGRVSELHVDAASGKVIKREAK
jgi:uncharacterized membrane protein YkoI